MQKVEKNSKMGGTWMKKIMKHVCNSKTILYLWFDSKAIFANDPAIFKNNAYQYFKNGQKWPENNLLTNFINVESYYLIDYI